MKILEELEVVAVPEPTSNSPVIDGTRHWLSISNLF